MRELTESPKKFQAIKKLRDIGQRKPFKTITVNTTYFKFLEPCSDCGKSEGIIAGVPAVLTITLPMTEEEFELASDRLFWLKINFELRCFNGFSHVAVGLPTDKKFIVSEFADVESGYWEEDESFEKALAKFIPRFIKLNKPRAYGRFGGR